MVKFDKLEQITEPEVRIPLSGQMADLLRNTQRVPPLLNGRRRLALELPNFMERCGIAY